MIRKRWIFFFSLVALSSLILIYLSVQRTQNQSSKQQLLGHDSFFVPLKIEGFCSADIPFVKVKIEGNSILAKIDLGYDGAISLLPEFMKSLKKKTFMQCRSNIGLAGKTYNSRMFELPKIKIGMMKFFPVPAEEENLEHEEDIILYESNDESSLHFVGTVGWRLFQHFNVLLDCEHSILALCDSLETLKRKGYPVESFIEAPLLLDRGFIEFEATTELGPMRCLLDTGCTLNLLNKNSDTLNNHRIFGPGNGDQYHILNPENKNLMHFDVKNTCETSSFKIEGNEFGPVHFNKIQSPLDFDAIIGMDFIDEHLIFINFTDQKIYFLPKEECRS